MSAGSVLVVCTGNVCRSPYIEFRLRHELEETAVEIASAGTEALVGQPIDSGSAALLEEHGIKAKDFIARQLTPEMVQKADLVLTATRQHRAAVARTDPSGLKKTMTLADFSDLVADMPPEAPKPSFLDPPELTPVALIASGAARRREHITPRSDGEADIGDPFKRGRDVFKQMERSVDQLLPPVIRILAAV